jgi:hypothetical protein
MIEEAVDVLSSSITYNNITMRWVGGTVTTTGRKNDIDCDTCILLKTSLAFTPQIVTTVK